MKNILGALALVVTLAGCALTPEELDQANRLASSLRPPAVASGAFVIVNQRAPGAARFDWLPTGWFPSHSCNLGILQLGDETFAPDRLERLENALAEAFPDRRGEQLIVRRYDIYDNDAETFEVLLDMAYVRNIYEPEIWRRPRCERERMVGGWYDPSDLTSNFEPITIDLEVSVFGRAYVINAARSTDMPLHRIGGLIDESPVYAAMVQRTMDIANARLIAAIRASEAEEVAAPSLPN